LTRAGCGTHRISGGLDGTDWPPVAPADAGTFDAVGKVVEWTGEAIADQFKELIDEERR
jgi:hypothetical protein